VLSEPQTPHPEGHTARVLAASLAVILLVISQMILLALPDGTVAGLLIALAGGIIFIAFALREPPARVTRVMARARLSFRAMCVLISILLTLTAAILTVVYEVRDRTDYAPIVFIWLSGVATFIVGFAAGRTFPVRAWLKEHRQELLIVALILLVAAALRIISLGELPRVIDGDEGLIGQYVVATKGNPISNPWSLFANIGGLYRHSIGLAIKILGQTPFALRLLPAIGGTLAVLALYALARHLFGRRIATFAAILLAVSHTHIHFSRTVAVTYTQSTLFAPLEIYFFISGLSKRDPLRMAIGGALLAVHFNTYLGAQVMIAFLIVYTLIAALIARPLLRGAWRTWSVFWLSFVVASLPQFAYLLRHPEEFVSRLNSGGGTFQSTWLIDEAVRTGSSQVQILFERVAHAFLSLNHYPALDFYGAFIPVLDVITATLFVLGMLYALWRTRDYRYLLLNGWFWSMTVAIGLFSLPPSSDSYRMLMALPAAIIMAAIGLDLIVKALAAPARRPQWAMAGLVALVLLAITAYNTRAYYIDFLQQCRFGSDTATRFASYLGKYLNTLDRETTVYLLSSEGLRYGTHPSVDFLSKSLPVTNVDEPVSEIQPGINTAIIAIEPRADELRQWARDYPGGKLRQDFDCGKLMLTAYWLP
jgi:4-amino-4-deoxy-L-arabinose transferase-like glycosyltransferase